MPSVYDLKPRFQALLRPLAGALARNGVTANQITVGTCAISIGVGLTLWQRPLWPLLPLWLFLRMAGNALDGLVAREHNQQSRFGALLNELTDPLADAFLFLPFLPIFGPVWIGSLVFLATFTELTSLAVLALSGHRPNHGPMGKSDRALALGLGAAWLALGFSLAEVFPALMALFLVATVFNRARQL